MKITPNKRLKGFNLLVFTGIIMILASSCKGKKETTAVMLKERNTVELVQVIANNTVRYNTLSARLNVNLKPGQKNKNISAPANLRIVKGKAIQLSFQIPILNAEMLRVVITTDSVVIIDRSNKAYVAEAINDVKNVANFAFDYYNLESLFTNQLFIAGQPDVVAENYHLFSVEQGQYDASLYYKDKKNVMYTFTCDYTDRIRKTGMESSSKKMQMNWIYDEFGPVSDIQSFPMKMKMDLQLPSDQASMDLSFSRVELNNDFSINIKIPDKYTRITLAQAIRIINNL